MCDEWKDDHPLFADPAVKEKAQEAHEKLSKLCDSWKGIKKVVFRIVVNGKTYNILYECSD